MGQDPACIFCKIASGEFSAARVLDTADAVAFLDINPVNHGHLLLVPKAHSATIAELPDEISARASALLPRLCRAVLAVTGADGLNVIVNLGRVAGQTVDHVHWHIIPRHQGDAVRWPWPHVAYTGDEADQLRLRIERELDRPSAVT
jgi:histidine triad (HIT) family protein